MRSPRPTLAIAAVLLGAAALMQSTLAFRGTSNDYAWFDPIVEVRGLLRENFVTPVDDEAMRDAAIAAMVESLGDPYTVYVPPASEDDFNKDLRGAYVGIGAEIDIVEGWLTIVTPLDESPALAAGVRSGDTVISIEGETTFGLSSRECADRLMGEAGTTVNIRVRHADGEEEDLAIVRSPIRTRTVRGFSRNGEAWRFLIDPTSGIAYIRVTQFTDETVDELREALSAMTPPPAALVLDLRFNGGGTLTGAIEMADLFLEDGTVVSVKSRRGLERSWSADDDADDYEIPMVVLVNGSSASASEIVAGALQENGRAKVLGQRTFGKGSVQEVRELPDDAGILKLTTAHYALPSGRSLHRTPEAEAWGVDPDPGFHVPMSDDQYRDLVVGRRAYEAIGNAADSEASAQWSDVAWLRESLGDLQLAAAIETLRARLSGGEWLTVGDESSAITVAADELRNQIEFRRRLVRELEAVEARIARLEGRASSESERSDDDATGNP
ncbi:MAG: S41 family peptidase [Phycisphaerales bacterium]